MVKGVDLRSTAGHCAWVRTPQLTFISIVQKSRIPLLLSGSSAGEKKVEPSGFEPEAFRMQSERDTTTPRSQMYNSGGHCLQSLVCCLSRVLRLLTFVAHACLETSASLAQLVARRSHNPKVVSSILTGGIFGPRIYRLTKVCIFLQRAKSWKWLQLLPWSSGYDARLTRERSPVQSREEVLQSVF